MSALSVPHDEALLLFQEQLDSFSAAAHLLEDRELLGHSRCDGWSRLDPGYPVRL